MEATITGKQEIAEFDTATDYIPDPLVNKGDYNGKIFSTSWSDDGVQFLIGVRLSENPGRVCSDGKTPVDGREYTKKLTMPLENDRTMPPKFGKAATMFDAKVKTLSNFAKKMSMDTITPAVLKEIIENGTWMGKDVVLGIDSFTTAEGDIFNTARGMSLKG